jgi:N-methylhydantoinase A
LSSPIVLGVDAGGTFTDFVCVEFKQPIAIKIHKALSTPAAPEQAILEGIRAMGLEPVMKNGDLHIIHGSTVATNAVLEAKGAKTVFVTNYGFADMLQLARQTRPQLYQLEFEAVAPPVAPELCLQTGGRLAADGSILEPLSASELRQLIAKIKAIDPDAVAINLLFSFIDDSFEKAICEAISDAGLRAFVSRSSQVLPEYREYERGIATWLNASLGPIVGRYLLELQQQLGKSSLQIIQSSGETIGAAQAADSAVNLLLSGPAGGLIAVKFLADQLGLEKIISFDMGGTSTDVALLDGEISTTNEGTIAQYPIAVSMVDMHTIGAGGGSVAVIDRGGMLQVGPRSAGADPGPACYGKGGTEATVTDANLVLGRLVPEITLAGGLRLKLQLALNVIQKLADKAELTVVQVAEGIVSVANEHMAKAIRLISVNRGHDPREFVLSSFGGAGGLHVCALAEAMSMRRAIVPVHGGVFSALGMVVANRGRQFSKTLGLETSRSEESELGFEFDTLEQIGRQQLALEGLSADSLTARRTVDIRYIGQSYALNVAWTNRQQAMAAFQQLHQRRYGYIHKGAMELVTLRVSVVFENPGFALPAVGAEGSCNKPESSMVYDDAVKARVVATAALQPGEEVVGPAVISEYSSTTFVAPGWSAHRDRFGNILLEQTSP